MTDSRLKDAHPHGWMQEGRQMERARIRKLIEAMTLDNELQWDQAQSMEGPAECVQYHKNAVKVLKEVLAKIDAPEEKTKKDG